MTVADRGAKAVPARLSRESAARDEAGEDSDVDILVHFDGPAHWRRFFDAQFYIEDLLGREVDLATEKMVRAEIRPYVEREIVHV